jgi:hypothetical protein
MNHRNSCEKSTRRMWIELCVRCGLWPHPVLALPKRPSPCKRRGTSAWADRVRYHSERKQGIFTTRHTEHTDWTEFARIGFVNFALAFVPFVVSCFLSTKRTKKIPHPVLALPKRPSPCERRGTSHSDRVRSNTQSWKSFLCLSVVSVSSVCLSSIAHGTHRLNGVCTVFYLTPTLS